ncbi:MAG: transposase [Bryobacterales bacterium]|nr:transposase [Acidobacteriota bacterium]MCB9383979.1 transposase [Bryobacterales bacterium]
MMADYRRRLPHEQPDGQALFLTWHLHGSLPRALYPPAGKLNSGPAFVWMDRFLDTTREGPQYLRNPVVAQIVVDAIRYVESPLEMYTVDSFVVMSNHVHLLVEPHAPPSRFMKALKNYSAREANRVLRRSGSFWQPESYDRWVRDEKELSRIRSYIHENPVKAGLAIRADEYRWSSAWNQG